MLISGQPWTGRSPLTPDKHARDVAFLDKYALERWEVSNFSLHVLLSQDVLYQKRMLLYCCLMLDGLKTFVFEQYKAFWLFQGEVKYSISVIHYTSNQKSCCSANPMSMTVCHINHAFIISVIIKMLRRICILNSFFFSVCFTSWLGQQKDQMVSTVTSLMFLSTVVLWQSKFPCYVHSC